MSKLINIVTTPEIAASAEKYTRLAAETLQISTEQISSLRIKKKSIDARSKNIKVNLSIEVFADDEQPEEQAPIEYGNVSAAQPIIIVGCGPAGLSAALRAIELGYKPIILERGKDVSERKKDIAAIHRNQPINSDSNYAFGEGGAGTYSDGKLYTRSKKRGDHSKALAVLHQHGAPENILFESHPHIGSDKLPEVVRNIRNTILNSGGEVHFNTRVTDITIRSGKVTGVIDLNGNRIEGIAVILATGHSARDIYELLNRKKIALVEKNFAMGVRIEHSQALIDKIQYKRDNRDASLPAASYQLVEQVNGRGVYSFCMCPGGFIVPASTADGECVVNGMSPSHRNSKFANAGLVTEIRSEDYDFLKEEHGILAGLRFQQLFEKASFEAGGGAQIAPAQRVADFVSGRTSASLPESSYIPGCKSSDMGKWLPKFMAHALREGLKGFDKKMRGFLTDDAIIIGVESRTSSPVRIPRDAETLQHTEIKMLFPCGEGAGYAGGIVSAMVDGERCVEAIDQQYK